MIYTKAARILSGSPYHRDHWRDIVGYAQLVLEYLDKLDGGEDGAA
jgi:hypothetical protein